MSVLIETSVVRALSPRYGLIPKFWIQGDLVFDLHVDKCPETSKNFLKLCKVKYYNGVIFHSVEKDYLAQTGDPTGTGRGGQSVNGIMFGLHSYALQQTVNVFIFSQQESKLGSSKMKLKLT